MSEVQPAGIAKELNSFPAVGGEWILFDTVFPMQPKRRKAATGIKLFGRFKQRRATSCTQIQACGVFVCRKIDETIFQLESCFVRKQSGTYSGFFPDSGGVAADSIISTGCHLAWSFGTHQNRTIRHFSSSPFCTVFFSVFHMLFLLKRIKTK